MAERKSGVWKWFVLLLLLGASGAGAWWYLKKPANAGPDYKTVTLGRGEITQVVTANGQINAVQSVAVGTQVSGIITAIKVDFNSIVTNGQIIAQIDPSTYLQNITQSEADLAGAAAGLELVQLNYRRAKELRTNELISISEYDKSLVELHQAQAKVRTQDAMLSKTKVDLERTTIYSPIAGVVISRNVDVGQTVAASFNTPTLFTIANDLRQMRIEAMVSEADVGGVREGQRVNFTVDAFPGNPFQGLVTQVRFAPITNQNVVNYTTVVEVRNDELKLRPGMTATASIITAQKRDALRLPNAAMRFRPAEGTAVKGAGTNNAGALAKSGDDARSRSAGDSAASKGSEGSGRSEGPGGGGGSSGSEERRRRFESMTPEQREEFRSQRARSGDGSPRGDRGGFGGSRAGAGGEAAAARTVYVLEKETENGVEKSVVRPALLKTGISDGSFTEVLDGLKEGDVVITGLSVPAAASAAMRPPGGSSPFGGPFGGGGMRPPGR